MMSQNVKRRSSIYDARIAGLYDLGETIGRGHYAVVKLAKHVFTGEKVAVKVIDKSKLDGISKSHLMQEVRCMKLVQHPNIVRLYEVIDTQTKLFLILELADYDMFEYIMKYDKGVSENEAQRYFCQIVEAIDYCHRLHVVHRDLKPENVVFFEELGMVKLTDFGFSNLFTPGQHLETSCGSLAYSAPEILLGDSYDAPAVDVWSLGVILYMLVCGRLPFQEANDSETLTKILDCSFVLPDYLSNSCKELIRLLLVRDPHKRAHLKDIVHHPWVSAGNMGHSEILPLVSRERVSAEGHEHIIEQMVSGGICGDNDEIHSSLEQDDYSYITATYYLLAERLLKKQRHEEAQKLIGANTKSDSDLEIASLALSPRVETKIAQKRADDVHGLVSPIAKTPPATPWQPQTPPSTSESSSRRGSWKQRFCSIVKEESEEELDKYLQSSRSGSRSTSPTTDRPIILKTSRSASPSNSRPTSTVLLNLQSELQSLTRISSGKRTPPTTSRSPSPAGSGGSGGGRTSPIVGRFKAPSGTSLRKLSSSPHLRGICEEGEDESPHTYPLPTTSAPTSKHPKPSVGLTYSSVRMIRPRQAVVSPDVIRRYDRVYGSGGRSRRSTSCSSSETSDDDSERRYGLIASRHCKRDGSDHEDDNDPPLGGSGKKGTSGLRLKNLATGSSVTTSNKDSSGKGFTSINGNGQKHLDTWKLIGKLQKLVLAPIREIPNLQLHKRAIRHKTTSSHCLSEVNHGFKQLKKPKSCEHLHHLHVKEAAGKTDLWLDTSVWGESGSEALEGVQESERISTRKRGETIDVCITTGRTWTDTAAEMEVGDGEMSDDEAEGEEVWWEDEKETVLTQPPDDHRQHRLRKKKRHAASKRCRAGSTQGIDSALHCLIPAM